MCAKTDRRGCGDSDSAEKIIGSYLAGGLILEVKGRMMRREREETQKEAGEEFGRLDIAAQKHSSFDYRHASNLARRKTSLNGSIT